MRSVRLLESPKKNLSMISMKMLCSLMTQFSQITIEELVYVHLKLVLNLEWQVLTTMQTQAHNIWSLEDQNSFRYQSIALATVVALKDSRMRSQLLELWDQVGMSLKLQQTPQRSLISQDGRCQKRPVLKQPLKSTTSIKPTTTEVVSEFKPVARTVLQLWLTSAVQIAMALKSSVNLLTRCEEVQA